MDFRSINFTTCKDSFKRLNVIAVLDADSNMVLFGDPAILDDEFELEQSEKVSIRCNNNNQNLIFFRNARPELKDHAV